MKLVLFIPFIFVFSIGHSLFAMNRDFHSLNGQKINGTVIKYFEDGDVLLERSKDLQLFRISLDIFTENDQAFVKNNFPPNHDALPSFNRPLAERDLAINANLLIKLSRRNYALTTNVPGKKYPTKLFYAEPILKLSDEFPHLKRLRSFWLKEIVKQGGN